MGLQGAALLPLPAALRGQRRLSPAAFKQQQQQSGAWKFTPVRNKRWIVLTRLDPWQLLHSAPCMATFHLLLTQTLPALIESNFSHCTVFLSFVFFNIQFMFKAGSKSGDTLLLNRTCCWYLYTCGCAAAQEALQVDSTWLRTLKDCPVGAWSADYVQLN